MMKKNDQEAYQKIIITGPVGVGKTTAIEAISDSEILKTDVAATDIALKKKGHGQTTIAMDYGYIQLEDGNRVDLYGTPGQERFDFMWEILLRGGLGLVILIDDSRPNPLSDLAFFLKAFENFVQSSPFVVGITKTDISQNRDISQYHDYLQENIQKNVPVMEVDARQSEDIKTLLLSLLFYIDPSLET